MNIQTALAEGQAALSYSPTPAVDARLLLGHVLGVNHTYLIAHGEQPLTPDQQTRYRAFLQRAAQQTPVPYLIGHAPFLDLDFVVTPDVLIPRPETELLVQAAGNWAQRHPAARIVDVGTGSGCIAISLARRLPASYTIAAVDVSAAALAVAQQNAQRHGVADRITFYQGNLLEPVPWLPDLIVANLPYVADSEWTMLADGVKWYEPTLALKGGGDGLDIIRELLQQASTRLTHGGVILLEIGWQQGAIAREAAAALLPAAHVTLQSDYAGHDRLVAIQWPAG
ncbi:MAG: peptide chain release factor N(5)-glutamine methyltransferase [Candidatus Promineifilaceae bacterium]